MLYLEYVLLTRFVIKIHNEQPTSINSGCALYAYPGPDIEDTFSKNYFVAVDDSGNPIGVSSYQVAPSAAYMLEQLAEKDAKIAELEQLVADLASITLGV